jgi:purine nucleosidase
MKTPVLFNHSAAIDDFVSTAVLSTMPNVDIKGIVVTNADCIATPAMNTTSRVNQFLGLEKQGIPLTMSMARGWNAFPWSYRNDCFTMGTIDILKPYKSEVTPPYTDADELIKNVLSQAIADSNPVVLLATGPVTAVTNVLDAHPFLANGIKEVIWMGGAVNVPGNLEEGTVPPEIAANKKAEWNAFWDPFAVTKMFQMFSDVKMFPLDITDQAKITTDFKAKLKVQAETYSLSKFVDEAYALVADEKFYEMWNTLATCFLGSAANEIYDDPTDMSLTIDEWGNLTQGWIHEEAGYNLQSVFFNMKNPDAFYDYVLQQLRVNV